MIELGQNHTNAYLLQQPSYMEQYIALHDYEKERADVLSFKEGDIFEVTAKTNLNWWAAHSLRTGEYGYVPRSYLEVFTYRCMWIT